MGSVVAVETCPECGAEAMAGPEPPRIGSEVARPYQYVRTGATFFSCPEHGPFSMREETVEGESVEVAVIRNDPRPDAFWVVRRDPQ